MAYLFFVVNLISCSQEGASSYRDRSDSIPDNAVKIVPEEDIIKPEIQMDSWDDPVPLPDIINTAGAEDSPFIVPDGDTLYFFFTPSYHLSAQEQLGDGVTGIYYSHRKESGWQKPEKVILNEDGMDSLEGCVFIEDDIMWFCSVRENNLGEIDFYTARLRQGNWTGWENAGKILNLDYDIGELHIKDDNMYFHSDMNRGEGGLDIWVSSRIDGIWQEPVNLYQVNTSLDEGWPYLTTDGKELWFTRFIDGIPAILRSIRSGGNWNEPEVVIKGFAGEPSLDKDRNIYFVHHYIIDDTVVESDIYVANKK